MVALRQFPESVGGDVPRSDRLLQSEWRCLSHWPTTAHSASFSRRGLTPDGGASVPDGGSRRFCFRLSCSEGGALERNPANGHALLEVVRCAHHAGRILRGDGEKPRVPPGNRAVSGPYNAEDGLRSFSRCSCGFR